MATKLAEWFSLEQLYFLVLALIFVIVLGADLGTGGNYGGMLRDIFLVLSGAGSSKVAALTKEKGA